MLKRGRPARLTPDMIQQIQLDLRPIKELSTAYGVPASTLYRILEPERRRPYKRGSKIYVARKLGLQGYVPWKWLDESKAVRFVTALNDLGFKLKSLFILVHIESKAEFSIKFLRTSIPQLFNNPREFLTEHGADIRHQRIK